MSGITETFNILKDKDEGALIGYLTLGDPDLNSSKNLLTCLSKNVDILEIGIPFSDPIADGPTIQAAMDRALASGISTDDAFKAVMDLRERGLELPLVFMTYFNIVLQYGEERFVRRCRETGVDGLLVSDLPVEESEKTVQLCRKYGVEPIFLIAPTTSSERVKKIMAKAGGFVYLISLLGVTGERKIVGKRTLEVVDRALKFTGLVPLVVGFGISKKEHVRAIMKAGARGVVVGSAFVNLVAKHGEGACKELEKLAKELKEGTR
jgi:tryptophan synthase alpha chain